MTALPFDEIYVTTMASLEQDGVGGKETSRSRDFSESY